MDAEFGTVRNFYIGSRERKHWIALPGELDLEESMELSEERLKNKRMKFFAFCNRAFGFKGVRCKSLRLQLFECHQMQCQLNVR